MINYDITIGLKNLHFGVYPGLAGGGDPGEGDEQERDAKEHKDGALVRNVGQQVPRNVGARPVQS